MTVNPVAWARPTGPKTKSANVFDKYRADQVRGSNFDPDLPCHFFPGDR
jgi:hypothetical protein